MYDVALINLAADARAAALTSVERPGLTDAELKTLLGAFCEIDAVDSATASPEIRVKVRNESFLIRTGQKKLMLYDVVHRELPAIVVSVDEAMAELDGSAPAARRMAYPPAEAGRQGSVAPVPAGFPAAAASGPRLAVMGVLAVALLGALGYLRLARGDAAHPAPFDPVGSAESVGLQAALAGVYLTGNLPGSHGIVFVRANEIKLFELGALAAPRVVHASGRLGRAGPQLVVATDQPGGLITVTDRDTLVYGGEAYRRIP